MRQLLLDVAHMVLSDELGENLSDEAPSPSAHGRPGDRSR
jgi:hypothetical protein